MPDRYFAKKTMFPRKMAEFLIQDFKTGEKKNFKYTDLEE